MRARLYQPAKNAMTSGTARTKTWVLEYCPDTQRRVDPLMGWTSFDDTRSQVKLSFDTKQAALDYAEAHGIHLEISEFQKRRPNIRQGGYGENFATHRRAVWTH